MEKVVATSSGSGSDEEQEVHIDQAPSGQEKLSFKWNRAVAKLESILCSYGFSIVFLFIYGNSVLLMFFWGAYEEFHYTKTPVMRWFLCIARGFGYTLNLNCALVILLASRLTFTIIRETPLNLVIPFDKSFPSFHIIVGHVILVAVFGHGCFHLIWIIGWNRWKAGLWGINMCVTTGFMLSVILAIMFGTSIPRMRKNQFSLFYFLHNIGAFLFFILLLLHGMYNGVPYTYKWIVGPLIVYAIDRFVRRAKVSNSDLLLSGENTVLKGANVIQLKVPKQFKYIAGQYAELKVESINNHEWHPFTIASAPHENSMCFYIKAVGDWTEELRKTFEDRLSGIISEPLTVRIRGPFGAPAQHVGGYQRVVLISGGVGATPFSSICKDLYHKLSFNDRYDDSESSSCGAEDPASLSKARQEIMRCVTDVYEQNNAIDYGQEEDCRNAVPLSLSNMFAETNEMAPSASYALSPMKKNAVGVPHLQDVKVSDQGSPVCNKGSEDLAYLRRLGYTSRAMGMQYNTGYETQRHKWSPTKGLDSRFVEHTLCMDTIRAASAVRNEVSSDRKERMMLFLHTVLMNFFLLALMLIRLVLVAYASIFRSSMLYTSNISSNRIFDTWLAGSEVSLGIFMMVLIGSTLCLEIMVYRSGFFKSRGRVTDLVLLFPISILSVFAGIHKLARQKFEPFFPRWVHFAVLVPILVILLFYRLFRVVGSRVLLADTYSDSSFEKMRAIDYIWTVPYEDDDDWLREEMEPLANGEHLRLHRFVTRQERNAEEGGKYTRGGMHTNFGRPKWEELFRKIAERTPSGGKVGVFFCGPKGMSKVIKNTIMKVQVLTNLRGTYLGNSSDQCLASELGLARQKQLQNLRSKGSSIRFIFREENFG